MSGPWSPQLLQSSAQQLVPLAILAASLAGSLHCAGMCGGLAVAAGSRSLLSQASYHFGRLLTYAVFGAVAGGLGGAVFAEGLPAWVSWISTALMAAALIFMGVRAWTGRRVHFTIIPHRWLGGGFARAQGSSFLTGTLTGFLPCGWLHGFVLGAAASGSALRGAGFMLVFWLGTVPALAMVPWVAGALAKRLGRGAPRLAAVLLVAAGLFSLGIKAYPLITGHGHSHESSESDTHPDCH